MLAMLAAMASMAIEFDGYVGYIGQEVFADLGEIDGRWSLEDFFTVFFRSKHRDASICQPWRLWIVTRACSEQTTANNRLRCHDSRSPSIRPTCSCHGAHGPVAAVQPFPARSGLRFAGRRVGCRHESFCETTARRSLRGVLRRWQSAFFRRGSRQDDRRHLGLGLLRFFDPEANRPAMESWSAQAHAARNLRYRPAPSFGSMSAQPITTGLARCHADRAPRSATTFLVLSALALSRQISAS
ncbi:MAG: hypothetical protein RIS70_1193 [Planctomycetota bacterium]